VQSNFHRPQYSQREDFQSLSWAVYSLQRPKELVFINKILISIGIYVDLEGFSKISENWMMKNNQKWTLSSDLSLFINPTNY